MIDKLRLLIREILVNELGTMGVTHPANDKKQKSSGEVDQSVDNQEIDQDQTEN